MTDLKEVKLPITDLMSRFEKQVADAEEKQKTSAKAEEAAHKAQQEYSASVAEVNKLKDELASRVGAMFPSSRVRQAS